MRGQVSQRYDQLTGLMRIAMFLSGYALMAAVFVGGVASSSGGNNNAAPVQLSAAAAQAHGATEAATDPAGQSSDSPARPICSKRAVMASTLGTENTAESGDAAGCGVSSDLAGGMPASNQNEEPVDVATLLAWHAQAYAY